MSKNTKFSKIQEDDDGIEIKNIIHLGSEKDDFVINFRNEVPPADSKLKKFFKTHRFKVGVASTFFVCVLPLVIVIIIFASEPSISSSPSSSDDFWDQYLVTSQDGAVATDTGTCSQIGALILEQGGNAVDAAIASTLCLGVISPASSGMGGGCHILIHNASTGVNTFIDSREYAPSGANSTMFVEDPMKAQTGGLAIAVLAEVKGLYLAWQKYGSGKIEWIDLVTPAAELAQEWIISESVAEYLQSSAVIGPLLSGNYTLFSSLYTNSDGSIKKAGDVVKQPLLAQTLQNIGVYGADYLYKMVAANLSADIIAAGGIVTAEDIESYESTIYSALETEVFGHTFVSVGGSSSGSAVVGGILKYMASYSEPLVSQGNLYYHRLVEGMKHAFAIRLSLGDPSFVNDTGPVDALLSSEYMKSLQLNTSDTTTLPLSVYGGKYNMQYIVNEDHGTSHIAVADREGNIVSMTSTINTLFGSKVISPSTGILLNNQMDDFSIPGTANYFGLAPSPLNYPAPFKRPLSSMSPSILLDKTGKPRLIGGASGGPKIILATAQVILNYIARGMDILSAITAPRLYSQLLPDYVEVEQITIEGSNIIEADASILTTLIAKHHNNVSYSTSHGVTQFIAIDPDTGLLSAVSDPRKGGKPASADLNQTVVL